ncbi:hypothetical protein JCM19240_4786 [Vibrio maritimus]|uniref:Uncharacterized protein n=1 Tax=Vibrio maritimus TaxID=990268 RepID=A0A090T7C6_9VIBR|nr:hypothetical protein JCM19240_4786 [Vibrio maritimus]
MDSGQYETALKKPTLGWLYDVPTGKWISDVYDASCPT